MVLEKTPEYQTLLMSDVWSTSEDMVSDYGEGIPKTISDESVTVLYYLLFSRYGNNPIANFDVFQWKMKIFSTIFQFGPTWEKKLELQKKIRELTLDDLIEGSKATHNTALNPQTDPSAGSDEELDYINQQNVSKFKKSKIDAYTSQWNGLDTDVTEEFLQRFKSCFNLVVAAQYPTIFISDEEEEE